jgi:hypothetical protein
MAGRCSSVQRALGLQVKSSVGGLVASFVFTVINTPAFDVHSLWHNNRNTYYIRVGTQSREPSPEELGRLFQQRGLIRAELRPVSEATLTTSTGGGSETISAEFASRQRRRMKTNGLERG